ncbi:hypothetical protein IWX91DRAFT_336723 [Phyllosticta citricarpa]
MPCRSPTLFCSVVLFFLSSRKQAPAALPSLELVPVDPHSLSVWLSLPMKAPITCIHLPATIAFYQVFRPFGN